MLQHDEAIQEDKEGRRVKTYWVDKPISRMCEVMTGDRRCGQRTTHAYQAMIGWMALCKYHAAPHPEAKPVQELIAQGRRWA